MGLTTPYLSTDRDGAVATNDMKEFVERHASVIDGAAVVLADGNLPPKGLREVARLCARRGVPLVFEPTSVAKCFVPFSTKAVGGIALTTPNLDELAAMSAAADGGGEPGERGGAVREGESLAAAALAGGKLVDARPLGVALKAVLVAMLDDGAEAPMAFLDGARHVAVTLGSAGVVLASARPSPILHGGDSHHGDGTSVVESPAGSGRWFTVSAEHYPALPLERQGQGGECRGDGAVTDCTGAGDCLVAGMIGGFALGWSARESMCLGLLCARQSVMADEAVPRSLGDIFGHAAQLNSRRPQHVLSMLPEGYGPKITNPWAAAE